MNDTENLLKDRRCIITGGSRGLGLSIAQAFAREGARVAFTYSRDEDDARDALESISEFGGEVLAFKGDVSDSAHVKETIRDIKGRWGGVDILVNNAGIQQMLPMALLEEEDWDRMMDVNLKGAYLYSRAVLRHMIRDGSGHILNIGSFASERFIEGPVHYAASKSALRGFSEALAMEVGRHNIIVNLLSPGILDTGMGTVLPQHRLAEYQEQSAQGRLGRAEEIAEAAVFLVSTQNTYMTGAKIVLDGGL